MEMDLEAISASSMMDSEDRDSLQDQDLDHEDDGPTPTETTTAMAKRMEAEGDNNPVDPYDHTVPDGGWGWVCAVSCALTSMLYSGLHSSFSIIFVEMLERFGQPAAITAWVYSVNLMVVMMGGPVATALIKRYDCRRCMAVAGVMYCAGLCCTGFAPSLAMVFLSHSILTGAAGSVPSTSLFVIIGEYFDKNRSKAIAIGLTGRGVSSIVFPIFTQVLFENFGFTGAFVIMGACFLHIVPLGMLLRPVRRKPNPPAELEMKVVSKEDIYQNNKAREAHTDTKEQNGTVEPLVNGDRKHVDAVDGPKVKTEVDERKVGCCERFSTAIDLHLLKELPVLAYFCHMSFVAAGITIPASCLAGLAKEFGVNKRQAALSLSAFGIASILTRVVAGIVFDLKAVRPRRFQLYALNLFVFSVVFVFSTLLFNLLTFIIYTVCLGICATIANNQEMVILADLVKKKHYTNAVGLATAFRGIGMLVGPPIGGMLRDITNSYVVSFVVAGAFLFMALLTLESSVLYEKLRGRKQPAKAPEPVKV